jgi:hypothetical protein
VTWAYVGCRGRSDASARGLRSDPRALRRGFSWRRRPITRSSPDRHPIKEDELWTALSFTQGYDKGDSAWAQAIKGSLRSIADADAAVLMSALQRQASPSVENS